MASKIPSGSSGAPSPKKPAASKAADPDVFTDDDGATPAGPARKSGPATSAPRLRAVGETPRPNGQMYKPRMVGTFEDIAFLRAARDGREHVLLYGPPGTGKTAWADAAMFLDAVPGMHDGMVSMECTADTIKADFVGGFQQDPSTGTFVWVDGPLTRSVEEDIPLYVDEIALADPRVLAVLYSLMDGRDVLRITENPTLPDFKVGPKWFVIATCNPDAPGAVISEALTSRFVHHVEVNTDWGLARELGAPAEVVEVCKNLDERRIRGELAWSPQLREMTHFVAVSARFGEEHALRNLVSKTPADDRPVVAEAFSKRFRNVKPLALGRRAPAVKAKPKPAVDLDRFTSDDF